jgi:hypothetical protein
MLAQYNHGFHTLFYSEGPRFIPVYCLSEQEHTNESAAVICTDFYSHCYLLYIVMQVKCTVVRYGEKDGQGKAERPFPFPKHTVTIDLQDRDHATSIYLSSR